jgi:hypothetical protein
MLACIVANQRLVKAFTHADLVDSDSFFANRMESDEEQSRVRVARVVKTSAHRSRLRCAGTETVGRRRSVRSHAVGARGGADMRIFKKDCCKPAMPSRASCRGSSWENLGLNVNCFTRAIDAGNYAACG